MAETIESCELNKKPSRYIPLDIVEKLFNVNSPFEFRKENRTTETKGHPKKISIKSNNGASPKNLVPTFNWVPFYFKTIVKTIVKNLGGEDLLKSSPPRFLYTS